MSLIGDKYLLTGSGRSDHDRLRVISEIHDGRTRELLLRAGFARGQRFVEFGCGLGYVARWAAGLEPGGVDMSYSRWLMVHLNKPVEAMRAIYSVLKPGGVVVCEEADVSAVYAEPSSPAYVELREIALEAHCRMHQLIARKPTTTP